MHPLYIVLISVGSALLLLFVLYLFLIKTHSPRKEMKRYKGVRFAHRGLHGDKIAENSMSAFKAAIDAGFGIELDVRLSSDGELVVFHDNNLDRVTNAEGIVAEKTLAELSLIKLSGTEDTIPSFKDVLELVDGKVPLLVEIKEEVGEYAVTEKTVEVLKGYGGEFIIESFNPLALARVKKLMPEAIRGVLAMAYHKDKSLKGISYFLAERLMLNVICRPDFVAYNYVDYKNLSMRIARKLFGATTVAWTVKSAEDEALAYKHGFDSVIFEDYNPLL